MGTVYKLTIENAILQKGEQSDTYSLDVNWTTEESASPYTGMYQVVLSDLEGTVDSKEVAEQEVSFDSIQLEPETVYTLTVTVKDQTDIKDCIGVTTDTYQNVRGKYDGTTLSLSWDKPTKNMSGGICTVTTEDKEIFSYTIQPYTSGMEVVLEERFYGGNLNLTVELAPQASEKFQGITVSLPVIFNPKYTVAVNTENKKEISYNRPDMSENKLVLSLDEDNIYANDAQGKSKAPDKPVVQGPLELANEAPYTLTVKTDQLLTRTDYDAFIKGIVELVTAKAMYQILELIARSARQSLEDILYFYCGLRPDKRCVDIRPGLTLRLEQEMYMPNVQLASSDAVGFIGTHTAEYPISYMQGNESEYLEFDSLIALMDVEIHSPKREDEPKPIGAGILDLCAVRMRNPYYRIQYPEGLFSSDAEPDIHAASHVILFAAAGWEDVPLPSDISDSATSYLLFRGRSALTLLITVNINGRQQKVPIGTTLGKLLHFAGIYAGGESEVCLYRRTSLGDEAKISFVDGLWEEMPLMHGDRITG